MSTLPILSEREQQITEALTQIIRTEIHEHGPISFSRFMELALYTEGLGYYSGPLKKFGREGDFITAPEISPLFARSIATQFQQILEACEHKHILELGAGSGKFARDVLLELEKLNCLPERYFIFEISPELSARQQAFLQKNIPHLFSRIEWCEELPSEIHGVIFANEVLDALPVTCFTIHEDGVKELCVDEQQDKFVWVLKKPSLNLIQHIDHIRKEIPLSPNYTSEINLNLKNYIASLAKILKKGLILFLDYGYGRKEFFHPERSHGTLNCFYKHRKYGDVLKLIGLQDITAHVEFTHVAECADDASLQVSGFTTQSSFLMACGILELTNVNELHPADAYEHNQTIKLLTLPSQMGEVIKVIGLTRNINFPLLGFSLHDRRKDL